MSKLTTDLVQYADSVNSVFRDSKQTERLPCFHRYPESCCEYASAYLGIALETRYPDYPVKVVRAYNHSNNCWHFWVEVGEIVVDITAYQFDGHKTPLVCQRPNPLAQQFPDDVARLTPYAAKEALYRWSDELLNALNTPKS